MSPALPKLYTPEEAARVLRVSPSYVRRLCRDRVLGAADLSRAAKPNPAPELTAELTADGRKPRRAPALWVIPEAELTALLVARGLVLSSSIVETDAISGTVEASTVPVRVGRSLT